jgi:hypothetical protein
MNAKTIVTAARAAYRAFTAALNTSPSTETAPEPLPVRLTTAETIAAIETYETNRVAENAAYNAKRKVEKTVKSLTPGVYGTWAVRFTPGRKTTDMDAVRAFYAANGAEVPTKECAPSVKITRVEQIAA